MLHAESKHDNFALAALKRDGGGFALETLGAVGVTGDEDVFRVVGIPRDDGALEIGRRNDVWNAMGESTKALISCGMPAATGWLVSR